MKDVASAAALDLVAADLGPRRPSGAWLANRHLLRMYRAIVLAKGSPEELQELQAFEAAAEAEALEAERLYPKLDECAIGVAFSEALQRRKAWQGGYCLKLRPTSG